jgi:hypothetical protein
MHKCPLCVEGEFETNDSQAYWFHLAAVHRTTEKMLERYHVVQLEKELFRR